MPLSVLKVELLKEQLFAWEVSTPTPCVCWKSTRFLLNQRLGATAEECVVEAFVEIVPIVVCEVEVSEMAAEELSSLYSTRLNEDLSIET